MTRTKRCLCVASALVCVAAPTLLLDPAAATAVAPVPTTSYVKSSRCVGELPRPDPVANGVSWGQAQLQYTSAWRFSRGAGVKIAIIDTGVNPGPAFGERLHGLADLVAHEAGQPGLADCDGHGTLVAGIAAAGEDAKSGFAGVAPDSTILSIRQSSESYKPATSAGSGEQSTGAGTRESLASAIDYATQQGAQVINISEADCQRAGNADLAQLSDAVRSAVAHDVVVVAAAGNLSSNGSCSTQNVAGRAPVTAATPADIDEPGVLTVAATERGGGPASFSLAGPWVDLAAPATQIVSTNPFPDAPGEVDRVDTGSQTGSIQGTSFAAPYVAGVAALVRARYPHLSAAQVADLLERTAAHPAAQGGRNDSVGYGVVDPVAALTASTVSDRSTHRPAALTVQAAPPSSTHARQVALWGTLAAGLALALSTIVVRTRRMRQRTASAVAVRLR